MSADGPWIKFYPADWLTGTRGMSPAETGVYITLIAMMYEKGADLADDRTKLARLCNCPFAPFDKIIDRLIDDGKIDLTPDGKLTNKRAKDELATRQKSSIAASQSATKRWEKDQQNQSIADADAMRKSSSRASREKSETRYQNKDHPSDDNAPAREPSVIDILKEGMDEETAKAVILHRKAVKAPLTPLAARGLLKALREYPSGVTAAVELMVTRGWRGFKRDWWDEKPRGSPASRQPTALEIRTERLRERIENEHGIGRERGSDHPDDERLPLLIEDYGRDR